MISGMASVQQFWVVDGVGIIKEVVARSVILEGGGYTITRTSELSAYGLQ